jgi:hypothetical protein
MSIGNLHGLVRGAINAVNPDISMTYLQSTGSTVAVGGKQSPSYAAPVTLIGQVQPLTTGDIKHFDFLNSQGIHRAVYLYGDIRAIVRSAKLGGDLLKFPQFSGAPVETWVVSAVDETYSPNGDWCRVIVTLQLDPNNPT